MPSRCETIQGGWANEVKKEENSLEKKKSETLNANYIWSVCTSWRSDGSHCWFKKEKNKIRNSTKFHFNDTHDIWTFGRSFLLLLLFCSGCLHKHYFDSISPLPIRYTHTSCSLLFILHVCEYVRNKHIIWIWFDPWFIHGIVNTYIFANIQVLYLISSNREAMRKKKHR